MSKTPPLASLSSKLDKAPPKQKPKPKHAHKSAKIIFLSLKKRPKRRVKKIMLAITAPLLEKTRVEKEIEINEGKKCKNKNFNP